MKLSYLPRLFYADNTTLNTGAGGDLIASDDIAGVKHQRVKVEYGADGSATDVSSTTPLPVQVGDTGAQSSVFPAGYLRVTDEPTIIFYETFDAAPDTTNVWVTTSGNSGVAPAISGGVLSVGTGTTANGYSRILTIPTFKPVVPSWLGDSFAIALPDGAAPTANAYRFWGLFSSPSTPTATVPITDGIGFELTTAGKLQAVVWAAGARTLIADLSSTGTNKQPLDASYHRYIVIYRTDRAYFYIDGLGAANLVATTSFQSPAIQTLATGLMAIGGATPPASNTQIQCTGLSVWDTGKNASQMSDGTYQWRKLKVNADGSITETGNIAHDGVDSGNPVKTGAKAISSLATATLVASADRTDNVSDLDGSLIARINHPLGDLKTDAISDTAGTSVASAVFTAVASTKNYITSIHVFRTDAGTTPIYVDFRDGTAGAVLWRMVIPAGGGSVLTNSGVPIFRTTANTALAYDVSAATTTVFINASGFQSKI